MAQYWCALTASPAIRRALFSRKSNPFPQLAEVLLEAASIPGPIATFGHFEKMAIGILAERVPDHSSNLMAFRERRVDLLPLLKQHHYPHWCQQIVYTQHVDRATVFYKNTKRWK